MWFVLIVFGLFMESQVRLHMMALMRCARVPRLRIDDGISIRCFLDMNPDQCEHLRRIYFAHNRTVHTVHDLVRLCGWEKSRPELLSMIACFFRRLWVMGHRF